MFPFGFWIFSIGFLAFGQFVVDSFILSIRQQCLRAGQVGNESDHDVVRGWCF